MIKRILFVDDEPLILRGLKRSLHSMRHDWVMDFAEGGTKALELISSNPYDAVVSDMIMPGMDGAQLLSEIQKISPQTIRLILSGHSGQDQAMKCVGVAHQFLSKPCEPEALKNTLLRVLSQNFATQNEAILQLVPRLERLPSYPVLYSKIVRLLEDPDVCMDDVGKLIAKDMAATAQVLKVVNSSFFGLSRNVSDPVEATTYLGMETVKALVLASQVLSQFKMASAKTFSLEALSNHGQQVGAIARAIAQSEQAPQVVVNECLAAGYLHAVGKLILFTNLPEQYHQAESLMLVRGMHSLDAEREIFGATHADIGGYLLGLWGLPPAVVEAIGLHHRPQESHTRSFCALAAVHVANALSWERNPVAQGYEKVPINQAYLSSMGYADKLSHWREVVDEYFFSVAA